ncbi:MAG: 2,3-bisphosphoglycerate-independent phosphoglycerate mutase [Clostridiales bacterium]|nr:2,3-bisphosphoglycerate-independent phosphoglycerate mutase [Clostridiales bacterium]
MKYILVIGDGMADNPVEALGGKTPLEKANIPTIDRLAAAGMLGSACNCPPKFAPGSDTAIMSIFGCDPNKYYTGRAPLEAAAQGVSLRDGDLAFRCNMVSLTEGDMPMGERVIISHSGGSIDGEDSMTLVRDLFADPEFSALAKAAGVSIYPSCSYRHIAVQSHGDGVGLIFNAPHEHLGAKAAEWLPHGNGNAGVLLGLMEASYKFLVGHPINVKRREAGKLAANCIWFWAEGTAVTLPSFPKAYGKKGAVISAVPLCHGIGALTGVTPVMVEGATGELDTNYEGKAAAAIRCLREDGFDFVGVHVEAPDECTHNGDLEGKLKAIEYLDSRVVAPIIEGMAGEDFRMLVISDHKTLTSTRGHDADPVPFIIYDSRELVPGSGLAYTEANGLKGMMVPEGTALLGMLFGE